MRHFYYALSAEYPNGKLYARLGVVSEYSNLKGRFNGKDGFGGEVKIIEPCFTKRDAEMMVQEWNKCYKKNGTLFEW